MVTAMSTQPPSLADIKVEQAGLEPAKAVGFDPTYLITERSMVYRDTTQPLASTFRHCSIKGRALKSVRLEESGRGSNPNAETS